MADQSVIVLTEEKIPESKFRTELEDGYSLERRLRKISLAIAQAGELCEQLEFELQDGFRRINERMREELEKQMLLMNMKLKNEFESRFRHLRVAISQIERFCEEHHPASHNGSEPYTTPLRNGHLHRAQN